MSNSGGPHSGTRHPLAAPGRRASLRTLAGWGAAGALAPTLARAQGGSNPFPHRPINLIVPWSAGGPTDYSLRELARDASTHFGQQVIVENKPGAGGVIAVETLLSHPADGYQLMQLPITVYRLPYLQHLSWDPLEVLDPLMQVSTVSFGVFVLGSSDIHTFQDLLDYGRAHPGKLTIGSTGVTSTPHLVMQDLLGKLDVPFIGVPFRGAIDQVYAVQSKTVVAGVSSSGFADPVDRGVLRLLAVLDAERSPRWPTVPTLKELGYDVVAASPYGLAVRQGTPPEVRQVLFDGFRKAVMSDLHTAALKRYDQEVAFLDSADFQAELRNVAEQEKRWAHYFREKKAASAGR